MRLLILLCLCFVAIEATHWAYGTAAWHLTAGTPTTARTYNFTLNLAFRRSYYTPLPNAPPYGPTSVPFPPSGSYPAKLGFFSCTTTACTAAGAQNIVTLDILMTPTEIIPLGDWFIGKVNFVRQLSPSPLTSNIFWEYYNCCRLSSIADTNNDLDWRITGVMNRYAVDSPSTTSVPRDYEDKGYFIRYSLLASHPAQRPFVFSMAPTACSGTASGSCLKLKIPSDANTCLAAATGCFDISPRMDINPTTGQVVWSPKNLGLFSVQFTITETTNYPGETALNPPQRTTIPLDMLFEIVPVQPAPYFYAPFPLSTPPQQMFFIFYRGVEGQYPVCARSNATGALVDINSVGLPPGATFTFTNRGVDAQGAYTCYLVKWTPKVDSIPATACYIAKDTVNGFSSRGSYCILMLIGDADCIYITGIIRDFHIVHADFALPKTGTPPATFTLDSGTPFVNAILPADRKPTLKLTSTPAYTSTRNSGIYSTATVNPIKNAATPTAEGYYDWWFTDTRALPDVQLRNKQRVETTILCNAGTPSDDIFRFLSSSYYPIDGQLFGNEGDPHNRYFTYEVNTYLTFLPGHVYTLKSSDDLWVFIEGLLPTNPGGGLQNGPNGWNLSGIRATFGTVQSTIVMDQFKAVQKTDLIVNETYRCDIFYAHRNRIGDPGIQIDLPDYSLCNGLTNGLTAFNFTSFDLGNRQNMVLQGAASWPGSGSYLELINVAETSVSSAAWYGNNGVPAKVKALYGFRTTFQFQQLTPQAEGFAFVLMGGLIAPTPGTQGANLGYASLARTIAFEFDSSQSAFLGDLARNGTGWSGQYSEVSIHAKFADANGNYLANSADESFSFGSSLNDPWMNFNNMSAHNIVIEYVTGKIDPNGAPSPSILRVFMNNVLSPVCQGVVNAAYVSDMFQTGAVWAGFTAANSLSIAGTIAINRWDMKIVPISPSKTAPVTPPGGPANIVAGDNSVFRVQTKDDCGNNILVGGESSSFNATYWDPLCPGVPQYPSTPVADYNDGTYGLPYNPTRAATYSFDVRFQNIPIFNNPFPFVVIPAATDPPSCPIIFGELVAGYSATSLPDGLVVVVFDQYGKLSGGGLVRVYDFTVTPARAAYTGGPAQFATFMTTASNFATGDYIVVAVNGAVSMGTTFVSNAAVISAMNGAGANMWPPTISQAYTFIGRRGLPNKCAENKALGQVNISCRGSDNRSQSGARWFTVTANSLLTPCGGAAGGYARINSVFDIPRVPAGTENTFSVMANDRFYNLKTQQADSFSAAFVPDYTLDPLPGGGYVLSGSNATFDRGFYKLKMLSRRSNTFQLYVKLDDVFPVGGPQIGMVVIVTPGPAYLNTSNAVGGVDSTGNGVATATAGVGANFYLNLKDRNGNSIFSDEPTDVITGRLIRQDGTSPSPPIPLTFTWVNDTTNNCAYCKLQASYNTTVASVPNLIEYRIEVTINGDTGYFGDPNVVAGPIYYPLCTHDCTRSPLPAGDPYSCTITTRDRFGNLRYVQNNPDPDFTYTNATSGSVFFNPPQNILSASVSYPGGGLYRITFAPKTKGPLTLSIQGPGAININGSPRSLTVIPGIPDKKSILFLTGPTFNVTAGTWYSFTMRSIDPYDNVRDGGVANISDYVLRFAGTVLDGTIRVAANSTHATTGTYTFEVMQTTPIGLYQVNVKTKFNDHVQNSPFASINIIPDLTYPDNTITSGTGIVACIANQPAFITLQARDVYNNTQLADEDRLKYTIGTRYPNATSGPTTPATVTPMWNGKYNLSYTCPALTGAPYMNVVITHSGQPTHNPTYAAKTWTYTVLILANAATSYAQLLNSSNERAGIINRPYIIKDCDNQQCDAIPTSPCQTSPCFRMTITNAAGETVPPDAFTVSFVTGTPLPLYAVTFISPYIGTFRIRVFRNGVVETEDSKAGTLSVYTINIGPGYVSPTRSTVQGVPATVLAGSTNMISVTLRDQFGYLITNTETVTANFVGPTSPAPPPVTCTQQALGSSNYDCSYTLTVAGAWTVQLSSTGFPPAVGIGNIRGNAPSDIFDITVQPLAPSCLTSTITDVRTPLIAGVITSPGVGTMQLNLRDMYNNTPNVNGFNGLNFDISFNSLSDMALPFASSLVLPLTSSGATYSVIYSPTKRNPAGGPNLVTAYIDTCSFGTANVVINPGAPAVPPSTIARPGPTVAGDPIVFTLSLQDRYGNPWYDAPSRVSVIYSGNTPLNVVSSGSPGAYTVTLPGVSTTRAWEPDYDFVISVDGNPLDFAGNETGFKVVAGPTDPLRTTMIGVQPQVVASLTTYQITTADQYGNVRRAASQPPPGSDQIEFFFMDGDATCGSEVAVPLSPTDPTAYEITVGKQGAFAIHDGDGVYHITWQGFRTGTYTFNVTVGGFPILCDNDEVQILTPDVAYPATSYWVIPAAFYPDVPAGTQFPITVTLRDRFGNNVEVLGANDVVFGNMNIGTANLTQQDPNFNTSPSSWMTAGGGHANFPNIVTGVPDLRINSAYNLAVTSFTASPLSSRTPVAVFLRYQGTYYLLKGHADISTGAPVIDIRILPGPAATFLLPTITAKAAYPHNNFNLQAADKYGNIVDTVLHSYLIILTRTTGTGSRNVEQINYEIRPVAQPGTVPGQHNVSVLPYWHGEYKVNITMFLNDGTGATYNPGSSYFNVTHATCKYEQPSTNYRCAADRMCVVSYTPCPPFNQDTGCSGTSVKCANGGGCFPSASGCPCPTGENRCLSAGGHCAPTCPTPSVCAAPFSFKCSTGVCRKSQADCPSAHVCSPGFLMCSDGLTCARSAAECGTPIVCAPGLLKCPSGSCVNEFSDCPTLKSCGGSKVVCPDGSCQLGREQCPDVYECINPVNVTSVRCPDGSCRRTLSECPTLVTCPNGYVLCESEVCAQSVLDCPLPTLCGLNQTRCPDGSCRHNMLFCPSTSTCPVGISVTTYTEVAGVPVPVTELVNLPVKCPDGSCKGSAQQCPAPPVCPYYRCSDGSCVQCPGTTTSCPDRCPTPIGCSLDKPLLCLDGSCVSVLSDCSPPTQCPSEAPTRCPDNSCRTNLLDCPSHPVCPPDVPVLCPDGQCGPSLDTCSPTQLCPSNLPYKCPAGFCAAGPSLCPTLVTCSPDVNGEPTIKCLDGTCRGSCDGANSVVPSCSPYLTCPQAGAGIVCASSLTDCPQAFTCPAGYVRCLDSSCRTTMSLCPAAPDASQYPDGSKVPCSDGTWAGDWNLCPTPSTCTGTSPYKCWDGTCRMAPLDCPEASGCSGTTKPFQCPSGVCTTTPWEGCSGVGLICPTDRPVKCLTDGQCYTDISLCTDPYTDGCATGTVCTTCPGTLCKDGSCRQDPINCPVPTCPLITPVLCPNGYCAEDTTKCLANNGCPWYASYRCPTDGSCVKNQTDCTSTLTCPPQPRSVDPTAVPPAPFATWAAFYASLTNPCDDGSCVRSLSDCYGENGCPANSVRCADGSCVDDFADCTSGSSSANACPTLSPYRCSSGFCAVSSTQCPNPIVPVSCPPERPIACISADCVLTASQCPLITPCAANEERCGDGTCRLFGHCPLVNTCPNGAVRCFSGICSNIGCNLVNGCPVPQVRCDNGQCVDNRTLCTSLPPNGCSIPGVPTPYKCSDGSCVADQSQCLLPNGCPSTTPQKCPADGKCVLNINSCTAAPPGCVTCADGRCVPTAADCNALNNCPIRTPYRCADGSCKTFPAGTGTNNPDACSTAVVCGPNQVLCADGACQSSAALCAPVPACPTGQEICSKDWQCHTPADCASPSVKAQCPPASPVRCQNGACKGSIEQCGFPGGGPSPSPCSGVLCQDGSCKPNVQGCMATVSSVNSPGTAFPPTASVDAFCPNNYTLCWDGSCVEACWKCAAVPRCPKGQTRCWNGDCDTFAMCQTKNQATPDCNTGLQRCEDGMCRKECCGYDGCGRGSPFHCLNRECATKETDCDRIASGAISYYHRRLLQTAPVYDSTKPCYNNCYSEIKASTQSVTVSYNRASVITLAVNSALSPVMRLSIPQGALVPRNGTETATILDIRAVPESRLRSAFNAVHPTRVGSDRFKYIRYLTFPQTVVSPAFECNVDENIKEPFNVNLTVSSLVDNTRRDPLTVWVEDICLASLLEIGQYKNWVCQFSSQYDRRLNCPPASQAPGCVQGKYVVRDPATAPPPENLVASVINRCTQAGGTSGTTRRGTVYSFITAPLSVYSPPKRKGDDVVESNIVPIVLGIIFIILFVLFLIYLAFRLLRYRQKYHDEKAEADRLKEEVDNMSQFNTAGATVDPQVQMTDNPLAAKMKYLEQAVSQEDLKIQQAEVGLGQQEAEIRKDHLRNMQANRDKMAAELEKLKAELAASSASTAAPSTMDEPRAPQAAPADAYRTEFDQYQAPRGGPKRRDQ